MHQKTRHPTARSPLLRIEVFTERVDNFVTNGTTIEHHLVAVFELNDDGKITAWREYFDTKDIDRQLAATKIVVPKVAKQPGRD